MANIFDQIHADAQSAPTPPTPAGGNVFDQIHAEHQAQAGAGQPGFWSRLGDAINPSNLVRAYADSLSGSGNPFSGIVNAATTAGNAAITPGTNGQGATPFRAAVASVPAAPL